MIFLVTKDVTRNTQLKKGCKLEEMDTVAFTIGGLSEPKIVVVAEAGLVAFIINGGEPEPDIVGPDGGDNDDIVGVGIEDVGVGGGGVEDDGVGVGVEDDDVDDEDDGYMQEPVLGLVLTIMAAPPKSQLEDTGFF